VWTERVPDDDVSNWPAPGAQTPSIEDRLARVQLSGSLECVGCGYDLKGLSITSSCPECQTAIRATILYRVDPKADEFRPLNFPRVVAWATRLWTGGALVAAGAIWAARTLELIAGPRTPARAWDDPFAETPLWALAASALGALLMVRPIRGMARHKTIRALVGIAVGYTLMIAGYAALLTVDDGKLAPHSLLRDPDTDRALARLVFSAGLLSLIVGIRPVARELVTRSLALRTKRVDRQTLIAIGVAVAFVMLGDVIWLWGAGAGQGVGASASIVLMMAGTVLVAVASVLLTLGLLGAFQDALRIARALENPPPGLRAVLNRPPAQTPPAEAAPAEPPPAKPTCPAPTAER
jgi:hypothetical protein